jgi:hypothetical protein
MVHIPLMLLLEWPEFPSAPCLAEKKNKLMTARVSMLLKQEKSCNSAHEQTPLSNDTINSVLRYREVFRTKD